MGALPKHKTSTFRKGRRRASFTTVPPATVACRHCGEPKRPHYLCDHCGRDYRTS